MILLIFVVLLLRTASGDAIFSCPTQVVTASGVFPPGASQEQLVPNYYHCIIQFVIPVGHIVEFDAAADFAANDTGAAFTVTDALSQKYNIRPGYEGDPIYAPATNASVEVTNGNGTAMFFVKWKFIDVSNYRGILKDQGTVVDLISTPSKRYFLFESNDLGQLQLYSTGYTSNIFVYDGSDLTANYIGRLDSFGAAPVTSSSYSLALVIYGPYSQNAHGISLDKSTASKYTDYKLVNLDWGMPPPQLPANSAFTFFGYNADYGITSLKVESNTTITFSPFGPDYYSNLKLTYQGDNFDNYMPQEILSTSFTMTTSDSPANVTFSDTFKFGVGYDGRKGSIISRSAWEYGTAAAYKTEISADDLMMFKYTVKSMSVVRDEEDLEVRVRSSEHADYKDYTETGDNFPARTMNGTSMDIIFTAKAKSSFFVLDFEMQKIVPVTTTTQTTTTAPQKTSASTMGTTSGSQTSTTSSNQVPTTRPVITTTRQSPRIPVILSFVLVLLSLF